MRLPKMVINSFQRERIFVSENQIFRLYDERRAQYSEGLKPTQIPEYILDFLVKSSEQHERLRKAAVSRQ